MMNDIRSIVKQLLIISAIVLLLVSCGQNEGKPELDIPSLGENSIDGAVLDEERANAGWKLDPTRTFSYLEYKGSTTPYFNENYEFNDNYFIYETTTGNQTMYGYMDEEFNKLSSALSAEPNIFMYNLARIKDDTGIHAIDTSFQTVDTYLSNYAKKGDTLILVDWTNEPDDTPFFVENIDYDKYLVPVMLTDSVEGGSMTEGRIFGYKTFNDAYIGDPNGETEFVIEPIFDDARGFFEGLAAVKINGKWGFINEEGEIVIDIIYDRVSYFREGAARVFIKDGTELEEPFEEKWALINSEGVNLTGFIYSYISQFEDGIATATIKTVTATNRGSRTRVQQVYIDTEGKMLYDFYSNGYELPGFSEGLSVLRSSNSYIYITDKGERAFTGSFSLANNFSGGYAAVKRNRSTMRWGYIDQTGQLVIDEKYTIAGEFDDGFAYVRDEMSLNGFMIDIAEKQYLQELKLTGITGFNDDGYALAYSERLEMKTMTNSETGDTWEEEVQETVYYMIHIE